MLWKRRVFLGVSGAIAVAVMIAAHEVMLPFIMAAVIAYVLTPLVARVERRRVPRPLAIVLVYAVVLGSLALGIRGAAPRVALEFRTLRAELPTLADEARTKWVPAMTARLRAMGLAPAEEQSPEPQEPTPAAAFVARPQADGSLAIDVGSGVVVSETKHGWVVEPAPDKKEPAFDPNRAIADVVGKSFAYAQANSLEIARAVRDLFVAASRVVFVFFITLMLAAYMMMTRERILGFLRSLVGQDAGTRFDALLARIDRGLSGVVRGQLVICGINGVLSAVGFAFIGLKYWPVMAIVAAVFSLVPIFGSIASAVPAVAIGLTQGLGTATFVLLWIVGIHQLEANVLNPKIMGDAAKIHPILVIFALLVGEHFFQAIGALLAVPTMSIAQSVFLHIRETLQDDRAAA
jgi:predicted PurR-regulated permease PerM